MMLMNWFYTNWTGFGVFHVLYFFQLRNLRLLEATPWSPSDGYVRRDNVPVNPTHIDK